MIDKLILVVRVPQLTFFFTAHWDFRRSCLSNEFGLLMLRNRSSPIIRPNGGAKSARNHCTAPVQKFLFNGHLFTGWVFFEPCTKGCSQSSIHRRWVFLERGSKCLMLLRVLVQEVHEIGRVPILSLTVNSNCSQLSSSMSTIKRETNSKSSAWSVSPLAHYINK